MEKNPIEESKRHTNIASDIVKKEEAGMRIHVISINLSTGLLSCSII